MKRKILCTVAALSACAMLFAACKKTDTTSQPESQSSQPEQVVEPTPTPEPYNANVLTG